MNIYMQGLTISLLGMSLTFLSLGLLILAMIVLERYFRDGEPVTADAPGPGPDEQITPATTQADETEDEQIAAVIATALAYWRGKSQSGLGTTMQTAGTDPWWTMGRAQQNPADALQKIKGK